MNEFLEKYFDAEVIKDANSISLTHIEIISYLGEIENKFAIELPKEYKDFLKNLNGYEGSLGESYVHFLRVQDIISWTEMYGGEFFPWIIYIGSDLGNEMYVIDMRSDKLKFGLLPFIGSEEDFICMGDTFDVFIEHLYKNDFWTQ